MGAVTCRRDLPTGMEDPGPGADGPNTDEGLQRTGTRPEHLYTVRIWLFGALAALSPERPLDLKFAAGFTARDVIKAMAERCDSALSDHVLDDAGTLVRYCRIFADGRAVEDLDTPLTGRTADMDIEMILLMGYEGG